MMIALKNGLMADPVRKAAAETVSRLAAEQAAKLKEMQVQLRRGLSALSRLTKVLDERDAAIDASLVVDNETNGDESTAARRKRARAQALCDRTWHKASEVITDASSVHALLQQAGQALSPTGQALYQALQTYEFSRHDDAPAPLPQRRARES